MPQEYLTKKLLEEFGDRKHKGRLSVITNLNEGEAIYPIPHKKEHIEFCTELVGDAIKLTKVIPSHIRYDKVEEEYEITSIITGESGMEQGYGIRHAKTDIDAAHRRILEFVNSGEVLINPNIESRIIYKYLSQ